MDATPSGRLPEALRPLFWDCRFEAVSWTDHRDFVIGRILAHGLWPDIRWLRKEIGGKGVRDWLQRTHGRPLDARRLRYWQAMLRVPRREVDAWLAERDGQPWWDRVST